MSNTTLSKIKSFFKKLGYYLLLWDGIWSVPLAILAFLSYGRFGEWYWGDGFSSMSPEFFHATLYSTVIIVFLNISSWMGMWFNYRTVFTYYLEKSEEDYSQLTPFHKICVILFIYSLYFLSGLLVIVSLV